MTVSLLKEHGHGIPSRLFNAKGRHGGACAKNGFEFELPDAQQPADQEEDSHPYPAPNDGCNT